MRNSVFIFIAAFLLTAKTFSQNGLPFYERNEDGTLPLLRTDSIPKDAKKQFKAISIISEKGVGYGKLKKISLSTQKECCTKPDPTFLTGKVQGKNKGENSIIVPGKIDSGKILDYDSLKAKTNLFEMISEEFEFPKINKEVVSRYRWSATELQGKKEVFLQAISRNNYKDQVITYNVSLKNCTHIKTDSTDFFYCTTDTAGNYKKEKLNWYDESIKWSLLYVNKKLIYVTPDFSNTTIRGTGPFHNKEQKLSAIYSTKGITYYYFSPGFVVYYKNREWKLAYRNPVKRYDECDCGE